MNTQEWKDRYKARLIERGIDKEFAEEDAENTKADLDTIPEDAADEEIIYMAEESR